MEVAPQKRKRYQLYWGSRILWSPTNLEIQNLVWELSAPLNQLNAILALQLHPLDRYRALSAMESAIGRPYLALSRIHAQAGALNRLVLNRLGSSTAR